MLNTIPLNIMVYFDIMDYRLFKYVSDLCEIRTGYIAIYMYVYFQIRFKLYQYNRDSRIS